MSKDKNTKSLQRKVRKSYFISTVSIALVLFLLGSVGYLILNAVKATNQMKGSMVVHVMLKDNISPDEIEGIGNRLRGQEEIRTVTYVSKEQAAEEFKEYIGNDFTEFLAYNPLPNAYEAKIHPGFSDKAHLSALEKDVSSWKGVDEVLYQKNIVEQMTSNINKFNFILLVFGGGLLFISLILLNNTIRLTVYAKRYMINTMKMVGASKWFIMRPFIGRSILHGIYAWLIAAAMFLGTVAAMTEGLPEVTMLRDHEPIKIILGAMLAGGLLISVLFTTFAVNKFVKMHTSKIYLY